MRKTNIKRSIAIIAATAMLASPGAGTLDGIGISILPTVSAAQVDGTPVLDKYEVEANVGDTVTVRVMNPESGSYSWYVSSYYATDKKNFAVNSMDVKNGKYDASLLSGASSSVDVYTFKVQNAGKFELEITHNGKTAICNIVAVQPVTAVKIDKEDVCLNVGESDTVSASVEPSNATDTTVTWTSSNSSVVSVNNGSIKALKVGTATITATCGDKTATCEVFVGGIEEDSEEEKTSTEDDTSKASSGTTSTTSTKSETVSSTPKTVSTTPASKTVSSSAPVLDKYDVEANVGDIVTVRVLNPESGNYSWYVSSYYATDKKNFAVNSSDVKKGKYDASILEGAKGSSVDVYTFKVQKAGKFELEITHNGETVVCNIVAVQPAQKIELNKPEAELTVGGTVDLTAKVSPSDTTDKTVVWKSSNTSVATVKNGKVKAIKEGEATITASCGDVSGTCNVFVGAAPVEETSVEKPSATTTTKPQTTPAKIIPCKSITWERMGDNTIVVSGSAARIGGTKDFSKLIIEVYPANTTDTITYSSTNEKVAVVDKDTGIVTYTGTGTADIVATATSGVSAKIHLVIRPDEIHCEDLRFTSTRFSNSEARVGGTADYKLRIETTPYIGNVVDTFKFSSSAPSIVSITEDGIATYHRTGKATIYVESSNGKKASTTVVIYPAKGENRPCVDLGFYNDFYAYGYSEKTAKASLTVDVLPRDTTSKITYYSMNPSIIEIDKDTGVMTFKKPGKTQIMVKSDNGMNAVTTINVVDDIGVTGTTEKTPAETTKPDTAKTEDTGTTTVTGSKVTNLYVSPSSATIDILTDKKISAKIFPTTLSNEKVSWSSSNTNVAIVNDGVVTAVGKGTCDITATCGGKTAVCKITVNVPLQKLNITPSVSQDVGTAYTMTYNLYPANASNQTITWKSADPSVASVDSNGKVSFLKEGTTAITASCDGKTATCPVTVTPVQAKSIKFPSGVYEINACAYTTIDWSSYVTPSNADMTNKVNAVTWTTSNYEVARYDAKTGKIYSGREGTATLTATLPNGSKSTWKVKAVPKADGVVKFSKKEYTVTLETRGSNVTGVDWVAIYVDIDGAGTITINDGSSIAGKTYMWCYNEMATTYSDSVGVMGTRIEFYKPGDYTLYVWPTHGVQNSTNTPSSSSQVASAPTDTCVVHVKELKKAAWSGGDNEAVRYTKEHPEEVEAARQKLLKDLNNFRKVRGVTTPVTMTTNSSDIEIAQIRAYETERLMSHSYTYDDNGNLVKATHHNGGECLCGGSMDSFGNSIAHTNVLLNADKVAIGVTLNTDGSIRCIVVHTY